MKTKMEQMILEKWDQGEESRSVNVKIDKGKGVMPTLGLVIEDDKYY